MKRIHAALWIAFILTLIVASASISRAQDVLPTLHIHDVRVDDDDGQQVHLYLTAFDTTQSPPIPLPHPSLDTALLHLAGEDWEFPDFVQVPPRTVVFVLDSSSLLSEQLDVLRAELVNFVENAPDGSQFALIQFDRTSATIIKHVTTNRVEIVDLINAYTPEDEAGGSCLFEALNIAGELALFSERANESAIVLVKASQDNRESEATSCGSGFDDVLTTLSTPGQRVIVYSLTPTSSSISEIDSAILLGNVTGAVIHAEDNDWDTAFSRLEDAYYGRWHATFYVCLPFGTYEGGEFYVDVSGQETIIPLPDLRFTTECEASATPEIDLSAVPIIQNQDVIVDESDGQRIDVYIDLFTPPTLITQPVALTLNDQWWENTAFSRLTTDTWHASFDICVPVGTYENTIFHVDVDGQTISLQLPNLTFETECDPNAALADATATPVIRVNFFDASYSAERNEISVFYTLRGDVAWSRVRVFNAETGVQIGDDLASVDPITALFTISPADYPGANRLLIQLLASENTDTLYPLDERTVELPAQADTPGEQPDATSPNWIRAENFDALPIVAMIVIVLMVLFGAAVMVLWIRRQPKGHARPSAKLQTDTIIPFAEPHEVTATMPAVRARDDAKLKTPEPAEPAPIEVFVSYHRESSALLATLIANTLTSQNIEPFVDTLSIHEAGSLSGVIKREIEERAVFICIINARTFESRWVVQEIEMAHQLGKPMIPVFHQDFRPKPTGSTALDALVIDSIGVKVDDIDNEFVNESLIRLVTLIRSAVSR